MTERRKHGRTDRQTDRRSGKQTVLESFVLATINNDPNLCSRDKMGKEQKPALNGRPSILQIDEHNLHMTVKIIFLTKPPLLNLEQGLLSPHCVVQISFEYGSVCFQGEHTETQ